MAGGGAASGEGHTAAGPADPNSIFFGGGVCATVGCRKLSSASFWSIGAIAEWIGALGAAATEADAGDGILGAASGSEVMIKFARFRFFPKLAAPSGVCTSSAAMAGSALGIAAERLHLAETA